MGRGGDVEFFGGKSRDKYLAHKVLLLQTLSSDEKCASVELQYGVAQNSFAS